MKHLRWSTGFARTLSAGWFATLLAAFTLPAAPPRLDAVFPGGSCRGQSTVLTAAGDWSLWPVQTWVDRPGVELVAGDAKGELRLTVAADAEPGVYWFRLHDSEGATGLKPLVIGTLPEATETEPNNGPGEVQHVELPVTVNGRLERSGDVDVFAAPLQAGQTLVAALDARGHLGSPMDGVLQLCDANGFVLAQCDDCRGLDPQLVFEVPREGTYRVRVFAFPATPDSNIAFAGGPAYIYRLTLTTGGFLDHALPLAVARGGETSLRLFGWNLPPDALRQAVRTPAEATSQTIFHSQCGNGISLPATAGSLIVIDDPAASDSPPRIDGPAVVSGRIDEPGDADTVRLVVAGKEKWSLRVESKSLGYPPDPVLELRDAEGKRLAEVDDSSGSADPTLTHAFEAAGEYQVVVRDLHDRGGLRFVYRLIAEPARPDFDLQLDSETYSSSPNKPLEIPVKVERREGFAHPIEIRAEGLPAGTSCDSVVSQPEGESAKLVKLLLVAGTAGASGPFRVVGTSRGDPPQDRVARFTIAGTEQRHEQAWITVGK